MWLGREKRYRRHNNRCIDVWERVANYHTFHNGGVGTWCVAASPSLHEGYKYEGGFGAAFVKRDRMSQSTPAFGLAALLVCPRPPCVALLHVAEHHRPHNNHFTAQWASCFSRQSAPASGSLPRPSTDRLPSYGTPEQRTAPRVRRSIRLTQGVAVGVEVASHFSIARCAFLSFPCPSSSGQYSYRT